MVRSGGAGGTTRLTRVKKDMDVPFASNSIYKLIGKRLKWIKEKNKVFFYIDSNFYR